LGFVLVLKQLGRNVESSPSTSAEVK